VAPQRARRIARVTDQPREAHLVDGDAELRHAEAAAVTVRQADRELAGHEAAHPLEPERARVLVERRGRPSNVTAGGVGGVRGGRGAQGTSQTPMTVPATTASATASVPRPIWLLIRARAARIVTGHLGKPAAVASSERGSDRGPVARPRDRALLGPGVALKAHPGRRRRIPDGEATTESALPSERGRAGGGPGERRALRIGAGGRARARGRAGGAPRGARAQARRAAGAPGLLLFRDGGGAALYVGKAKSLRARVRSYFQEGTSDGRAFIPLLRRRVADLETIVTATEKEAAILENSLIKEARPRYNFKLRDDKEFLTLRLDTAHAWPGSSSCGGRSRTARATSGPTTRRPRPDARCSSWRSTSSSAPAPIASSPGAGGPPCSTRSSAAPRPASSPSIGRATPRRYAPSRSSSTAGTTSSRSSSSGRWPRPPPPCSTSAPAAARDQLAAVRAVRERQRVVAVTDRDQDALGLYREGDRGSSASSRWRRGRVVDAVTFSSKGVEVPNDEVVAAFLRDQYGDHGPRAGLVPDEVLVPVLPEGAAGVAEWLSDRRAAAAAARGEPPPGGARSLRCALLAPARGPRRELVDLATENARHAFAEKARAAEDLDQWLLRLRERLRLPTLPRRIECVDISHLGGADTVGAVVAFTDGVADKARYRTYRVSGVRDGDDYAAMAEVLGRRFRRGKAAREAGRGRRDGGRRGRRRDRRRRRRRGGGVGAAGPPGGGRRAAGSSPSP
jgi:hypothetical protein